jgi:hypothetical protein
MFLNQNMFTRNIGCSFKFPVKVGVEETIVNAQRIIRCLNLTSLFALFVFLVFRLTNGAFTIDSFTATLTGYLNERPIYQ